MAGCFSVRALTEDDFAVTQCAPRNPNLSQPSGESHSNWRLIGDCTLRGRIEEVIRTEAEMFVAYPACQDAKTGKTNLQYTFSRSFQTKGAHKPTTSHKNVFRKQLGFWPKFDFLWSKWIALDGLKCKIKMKKIYCTSGNSKQIGILSNPVEGGL